MPAPRAQPGIPHEGSLFVPIGSRKTQLSAPLLPSKCAPKGTTPRRAMLPGACAARAKACGALAALLAPRSGARLRCRANSPICAVAGGAAAAAAAYRRPPLVPRAPRQHGTTAAQAVPLGLIASAADVIYEVSERRPSASFLPTRVLVPRMSLYKLPHLVPTACTVPHLARAAHGRAAGGRADEDEQRARRGAAQPAPAGPAGGHRGGGQVRLWCTRHAAERDAFRRREALSQRAPHTSHMPAPAPARSLLLRVLGSAAGRRFTGRGKQFNLGAAVLSSALQPCQVRGQRP